MPRRPKPDPIHPDIRQLAERIAAALFTCGGTGRKADRLVMEFPERPLDGGGWGEPFMADHIAKMLAEAWPGPRPGDPEASPPG